MALAVSSLVDPGRRTRQMSAPASARAMAQAAPMPVETRWVSDYLLSGPKGGRLVCVHACMWQEGRTTRGACYEGRLASEREELRRGDGGGGVHGWF